MLSVCIEFPILLQLLLSYPGVDQVLPQVDNAVKLWNPLVRRVVLSQKAVVDFKYSNVSNGVWEALVSKNFSLF